MLCRIIVHRCGLETIETSTRDKEWFLREKGRGDVLLDVFCDWKNNLVTLLIFSLFLTVINPSSFGAPCACDRSQCAISACFSELFHPHWPDCTACSVAERSTLFYPISDEADNELGCASQTFAQINSVGRDGWLNVVRIGVYDLGN